MRNLLQFLVRYSNFLIFLILEVVAFILIVTHHQYQRSVFFSSSNNLVAGIQRIETNITDYFHLRKDNQALAEENAYLKNQLMLQANEDERQNERENRYLYSHLQWNYIPAKVIGITTHKHHNYLTINKGSRDNVAEDMGVVCSNGVVGIVSAVSERYALVVPIIHTEMNLSCRLEKNDCICRTQWTGGNSKEVSLRDISRHILLEEGDTVVTSGLTPIFPEGIMVGIVSENYLDEGDNYHRAILRLATDYQSIKYVQVIQNPVSRFINNENSRTQWSGLEK